MPRPHFLKGTIMKHQSAYATKSDFTQARLGYPFMECCRICGEETGAIIMKKKGNGLGKNDAPKFMINPDADCEFCHFVGLFMHNEGLAGGGVRYGAAKIVTVDDAGARTLFAYLPFGEDEDPSIPLNPDGHEEVAFEDLPRITIKHRMVILAVRDTTEFKEGVRLTKVLEPGID